MSLPPKGPLFNASSVSLSENPATLPNMSDALLDWFQPMIFGVITKSVVNFQVKEVAVDTQFFAIWQPASGREIWMRQEGERKWEGVTVHALPGPVQLNIDDVIIRNGKQYRCASKKNFSQYGYVQYGLIEDFSGSGPGGY